MTDALEELSGKLEHVENVSKVVRHLYIDRADSAVELRKHVVDHLVGHAAGSRTIEAFRDLLTETPEFAVELAMALDEQDITLRTTERSNVR